MNTCLGKYNEVESTTTITDAVILWFQSFRRVRVSSAGKYMCVILDCGFRSFIDSQQIGVSISAWTAAILHRAGCWRWVHEGHVVVRATLGITEDGSLGNGSSGDDAR